MRYAASPSRVTCSRSALTTYTDIRRSALCREHVPALVEAAATIGAAQIQNRGTLGGNIANASPAGDTLPVLLAADAVIVVGLGTGGARRPGGRILDGLPPDGSRSRRADPADPAAPRRGARDALRKVGTRRAQAISQGRDSRRVAGRRRRGVRSASPSAPWRPHRSGRMPRNTRWKAISRRPRRRTEPPRHWPRNWRPSTTSARPPSTGVSWPRVSCTGSSATPAAGDRPAVTLDRAALKTLFEGAPSFLDRLERAGRSRPMTSCSTWLATSPTRCPRTSRSS